MTRLFTSLSMTLALVLAAGAVRADAPPVTNKDNAVSINPLALAFGGISGNFEHKLNPKASVLGELFYSSHSLGGVSSTVVGLGAGYRMYFQPVAMDGWYWEPNLSVASQSVKVDVFGITGSGSGVTFAPGVIAGRQWMWDGGFFIDLALGAAFYIGGVDVNVGGLTYSGSYSGIAPSGTFALGYAWK